MYSLCKVYRYKLRIILSMIIHKYTFNASESFREHSVWIGSSCQIGQVILNQLADVIYHRGNNYISVTENNFCIFFQILGWNSWVLLFEFKMIMWKNDRMYAGKMFECGFRETLCQFTGRRTGIEVFKKQLFQQEWWMMVWV